jgi:hypothetical protein
MATVQNRNVAISHATELLPLCVVHVGFALIVYLFDRSPISGRRPAKLSHRVANWEENGHSYSRKYTVANILFFGCRHCLLGRLLKQKWGRFPLVSNGNELDRTLQLVKAAFN